MYRLLWVLTVLAGCGFSAPASAPVDAGADAAPPVCGDLTCDPHATCDPSTVRCACSAGYTGDGMTCTDLDECATSATACPAACANMVGLFICYAPTTCAEVTAHVPTFSGGDVTLYASGMASRPWTAFCAPGAGGLVEYLTVQDANQNFGQYTSGTSVRTRYARIRLNPATMKVDISDQRFATSTGSLMHGGTQVTAMPLGVAMDCAGGNSASGVGHIDLTGTPFVVSDPYERAGNQPGGTASFSQGGRIVAVTGGGNCGYNGPAPLPFNPFNQVGGPILDVTYTP